MPLAGFNLAASPTLAARVMHTSIADKLHIVCGASPLEG